MTRWAWVIDQTTCIGCQACTTACKSENDVAVGSFRTWVKHVDVGTFPEVKRQFAVLRCNHCADAPCVEICPVTAMYQRPDGLVDFDEDACIGCKACMQACPYDAIHIDPASNTAHKCNFCSHRVDEGLLPACVVVCPVEALVFGDMDDPTSRVSREIAAKKVTVRRPEQRTQPHAFYIGAHPATLDPLAADHEAMYMWADRGDGGEPPAPRAARTLPIAPTSHPTPARVAYDIPRQRAWGWRVSSYIWTKSLAAGGGLVAAVAAIIGAPTVTMVDRLYLPVVGLLALVATGVLLIVDLKRPERFWTILTRPQWRSWLARGAVIITVYGALLAVWLVFAWLGNDRVLAMLAWPTAIVAMLTSIYTAFLFAQCEGRDLWQDRRLFVHLTLHPIIAGLAALQFVVSTAPSRFPLTISLVLFALVGLSDVFGKHATDNAAAAAAQLRSGRQSRLFWGGLLGGAILPAVLLALGGATLAPVAAFLALGGLWLHAHALVLAGQGPPIS